MNFEEVLGDVTDDEDFVEVLDVLRNVRRTPKIFRERPDFFDILNDNEFIKRFRLSKNAIRFVLNRVWNQIISPTEQNHAVTPEEMLLLTLRYYVTGNFLQTVGDLVGVDKGTASRLVWKVTRAIAGLYNEFSKMPVTEDDMRRVSQKFYNVARFPKCIGALDCTHVKILSPGGENAEVFRNRKGFFSYNVQAVCNADCFFEDVVCRWPGSAHDSNIFANCNTKARFERGEFQDYVLVGDSGYGIRNYLITPLANPVTQGEVLFNESQIRTRNCIERKFGQWKRRFPILSFGIRLDTEKVEAVVIATAVTENIAKLLNDPEPPFNEEEQFAMNVVNEVNGDPYMNVFNINNRNALVRHQLIGYFSHLV